MAFIFAALTLLVTAAPAWAETVNGVKYIDADGEEQTADCTAVTNSDAVVLWNDGWYEVQDEVNLTNYVVVTNTVNLILCDGCRLTVKYLAVNGNATLNIFGQSGGSGELIASDKDNLGYPGIGHHQTSSWTLTINGGKVTAYGSQGGAGIGGADAVSNGTVIINGGEVYAEGGSGDSGRSAAGIGGGSLTDGGNVIINGGRVTAKGGGGNAPGIGKGTGGNNNGNLSIAGDMVLLGSYDGNEYHRIGDSEKKQYMRVVPAEARIGQTLYPTVEEAFTAVQGGETVTLLQNAETDSTLTVSINPVTLDLNGNGISGNSTPDNKFSVITVESTGNLTIEDSNRETTHYYTVSEPEENGAGLATLCDKETYDSAAEKAGGTFKGGYITGGRGTKKYSYDTNTYGGGIFVKEGSDVGGTLTMKGGTLIGNTADNGGGIYANTGSVTMKDCAVIGNKATITNGNGSDGGGIFANNCTLMISDSDICRNYAVFSGGGMCIKESKKISLNNNSIIGNTAVFGGGAHIEDSEGKIENSVICRNIAKGTDDSGEGGGMYLQDGEYLLKNVTIGGKSESDGNKAGKHGGGLKINGGLVNMTDCETGNNEAGRAGGIYCNGTLNMNGGSIYCNKTTNTKWAHGGGVFLDSGTLTMTEGTIRDNEAGGSNARGGGVYQYSSTFNMTGGSITGNKIPGEGESSFGGGVYFPIEFYSGNNKFIISGNAIVADNKRGEASDNVFLDYDNNDHYKSISVITVSGKLSEDSRIGVAMKDKTGVITSGLDGNGSASNFFSDDNNYTVGLNDDNEAVLFEKQYIAAPSAASNLTYSGKTQTGVEPGTGYTLTGNTATKAGEHTATAALENGYFWSDGTTGAKTINWSIAPKAVTVTAENKTKAAGEADPELTAKVEGLVAGEPESLIIYKLKRESGDIPGTYAITPEGDETQGNYVVTYKTGILTIKDKAHDPDGEDDPKDPLKPDKVPVTGAGETYAAPEDNFAPVTSSGKINKLFLDFTNVAKSGINPEGLKMTVISGSKFTTKEVLKDKKSFTADKGIKVKVNKKTMIPTITCKKSGKVTLYMEGDKTYTLEFTVQKPKAQKSAKKIVKGSGSVTKTIHDLFGTDIDAGELSILKQKHSQAALSGNSVKVDPEEKDSIKVQYKYLNKKYKLTMKVK